MTVLPDLCPDARQMLESLADGVYATDTERRIIFWNRAAERITGYRADEVLGRSCSGNLLVHVDKDGHALCGEEHCPLHRAIVTGQASRTPVLVHAKCRDGHRIPTEVSVAPLRDKTGRVIGGVEVFRDVTQVFESLTRAAKIQQLALECPMPYDQALRCAVQSTPCDYVGGDFYRIERLGADRYAALVADVMGHGLAAALHTMQLRTLWEELRDRLGDPAEFLSAMHARLAALVKRDDYFATAVAVLIDVRAGELRYATAGHLPPFVYRRERGGMDTLSSTGGLPLGVCAVGEHQVEAVSLAAGDVVLLCTDGVFEIEDRRGRPLGVEGFSEIVCELGIDGSRASLARIESALLAYSDALRLPDDLTLLAAAFKGATRPS